MTLKVKTKVTKKIQHFLFFKFDFVAYGRYCTKAFYASMNLGLFVALGPSTKNKILSFFDKFRGQISLKR